MGFAHGRIKTVCVGAWEGCASGLSFVPPLFFYPSHCWLAGNGNGNGSSDALHPFSGK